MSQYTAINPLKPLQFNPNAAGENKNPNILPEKIVFLYRISFFFYFQNRAFYLNHNPNPNKVGATGKMTILDKMRCQPNSHP